MRPLLIGMTVAATVLLALPRCQADMRSFEGHGLGVSGRQLDAQAEFETPGSSTLKVTLSNISPADVMANPDILTAVFFNISSNPALSKGTAALAPGSSVWYDSAPPGGNVGGEWAFRSNTGGSGGLGGGISQQYGISSAGLNIFGADDRFDVTQNLDGPTEPGGTNYGLTSAGDDPLTPDKPTPPGPVTGDVPLIHSSVVFTLTGLPTGFDLADITSVRFQYGTDVTEPSLTGSPTPEPGTLALLGLGATTLVARRRRRRAA